MLPSQVLPCRQQIASLHRYTPNFLITPLIRSTTTIVSSSSYLQVPGGNGPAPGGGPGGGPGAAPGPGGGGCCGGGASCCPGFI